MASVRIWLAAVLAACAVWPAAAAPLATYGELPAIEAAAISPDGASIAMLRSSGGARQVVITAADDGRTTHVLPMADTKVRGLQWGDATHLFILTTVTGEIRLVSDNPRAEHLMTLEYDLGKRRLNALLADAEDSLNVSFSAPQVRLVDGVPTAFIMGVHFTHSAGAMALYKVNLDSGKSTFREEGLRQTSDWLVGPDGEDLAMTEFEGATSTWRLHLREGGAWRRIVTLQAPIETPEIWGLGRDGASALIAVGEDDATALYELPPGARDMGEPIAKATDITPIRDAYGAKLIGYSTLDGDTPRYTFFNPDDERAWAAVTRAFPGSIITRTSASADGRKFVILVDTPGEAPAYALVDLDAKKVEWIGEQYEGLSEGDIATVQAVRFKAKDGVELGGYLTLPKGREAKGLPLVVLPHGGPASRDTPGFDWWAQAIASRGYAVLQVNFRGSDGFGWSFVQAGFGEWGRKMQTDLSDGVRDLAAKGVIDPTRVCIVGASYGGYAALAGATLDRGVYRCAASVAGVSDLRRMVVWSKAQNGVASQRYWTRFMGAEDPKDPVLAELSPALLADKVEIPILLIHGRDDTVVPLEQSRYMAEALEKAGKPVEFVIEKGEDHWLSRGDTRLQMLQSVVAFLEKNNPPN